MNNFLVEERSLGEIVHDYSYYDDSLRAFIVDILLSDPVLRKSLRDAFFDRPSPTDLFIISLAQLKDNGDIDSLVRALNWQHNDIAFLSSRLEGYERSLQKLDDLRREVARLRDDAVKLRERNSALIRALKDSNVSIPKSMKKKVTVKPPKPRL